MTILETTSIISSLCAIISLLISAKNSKEIKKIKTNNGPNFKYCSSVGNQGDGFRITQNQK